MSYFGLKIKVVDIKEKEVKKMADKLVQIFKKINIPVGFVFVFEYDTGFIVKGGIKGSRETALNLLYAIETTKKDLVERISKESVVS